MNFVFKLQAHELLATAKRHHRSRVARRREEVEVERQAQFKGRVGKSASKRGYKLTDNDRATAQVLLLGGAVEADIMASHALPKAGAVMQRVYVQAVGKAPVNQPRIHRRGGTGRHAEWEPRAESPVRRYKATLHRNLIEQGRLSLRKTGHITNTKFIFLYTTFIMFNAQLIIFQCKVHHV